MYTVTGLMQDGMDGGDPLARRPQSSAAYVHLRSSSPGALFVGLLSRLCHEY